MQHKPFGEAISSSIALTLWAFLGMESACANSDAVENPKKNVPIAVMAGTGIAAVIYILSTTAMQGIVPNAVLSHSAAPFGLAFSMIFLEWLKLQQPALMSWKPIAIKSARW